MQSYAFGEMRLICPNCGAQYEIDAALVPDAGRDVQCSACGQTWFQRRETSEEAVMEEAGVTAPLPDPPADAPEDDPAPEPETTEPDAPEMDDLPEPPRQRRPDQAALAILREEAEREAEARRREAQGLETQGDLGLSGEAPGRGTRVATTGSRKTWGTSWKSPIRESRAPSEARSST